MQSPSPPPLKHPAQEDDCMLAPITPRKNASEVAVSPVPDSRPTIGKGRCITPDSVCQPPAKRRRKCRSGRRLEKGLSLDNIIPTPTRQGGSLKRVLRKKHVSPLAKARYSTRTAVNGGRRINYDVKKQYDMMLGRGWLSQGVKRAHSFNTSDDAATTEGDSSLAYLSGLDQPEIYSSPFAKPIPRSWAELNPFDKRIYLLQKGDSPFDRPIPKLWPEVVNLLLDEKLLTESQLENAGGEDAIAQRFEAIRSNLRNCVEGSNDSKATDHSGLDNFREIGLFDLNDPEADWTCKNQGDIRYIYKRSVNDKYDESGIDADEELSSFCDAVIHEDDPEDSSVDSDYGERLFTDEASVNHGFVNLAGAALGKLGLDAEIPDSQEDCPLTERTYGLRRNGLSEYDIAERVCGIDHPVCGGDCHFVERLWGLSLSSKKLPQPDEEEIQIPIERDTDGVKEGAFGVPKQESHDAFSLPVPPKKRSAKSKRLQKKRRSDFQIYEDPVDMECDDHKDPVQMMDLPKENFAEVLEIEDTDVVRELMDGTNPRASIQQRRAARQGLASAPGLNRMTPALRTVQESPEPEIEHDFVINIPRASSFGHGTMARENDHRMALLVVESTGHAMPRTLR
ncbi:hypothetical protein L228DRAFT_260154 [Xylona heveae TC161]|uniref:Uncharacterized protein n=1 Tax=Xylona heveae (strain CBS 132557 / TC161) TaxID=1328760 RepID=A0A165HCN6_XYLHT|nr:hypothetical protein L228DRAFT_260154 [Xylona heveae TC161]KZF23308.1 hypothetical protein L228DRAFT_260154 [Xylona heveae TC161]